MKLRLEERSYGYRKKVTAKRTKLQLELSYSLLSITRLCRLKYKVLKHISLYLRVERYVFGVNCSLQFSTKLLRDNTIVGTMHVWALLLWMLILVESPAEVSAGIYTYIIVYTGPGQSRLKIVPTGNDHT